MKRIAALLLSGLLCACQAKTTPAQGLHINDLQSPPGESVRVWLPVAPLPSPNGLRPCCAFGYNLRSQLFGIPLPLYRIANVVAINHTGHHRYNDRWYFALADLSGLGAEHNGLIYTRRGGFIDLAHVRDTADNTLWLFSQLWQKIGSEQQMTLSDEEGIRVIRTFSATLPSRLEDRYRLTVALAAHLAFQLAAWHEIAQWYGFASVPGFPEGVSAFSPEDLYSNLLGARIAIDLLNQGAAGSVREYQQAMDELLPQALAQLQAVTPDNTRFQFDMLDGQWWNSHCRLPEKFLLRHRNYNVSDRRQPSLPDRQNPGILLTLNRSFHGKKLDDYARLEIERDKYPLADFPAEIKRYHYDDFPALARYAERQDSHYLRYSGHRCR